MKAMALLRVLERAPLCYESVRVNGSHRRMESNTGYPPLTFAFHTGQQLPPGVVRKILTRDVGLTDTAALDLL